MNEENKDSSRNESGSSPAEGPGDFVDDFQGMTSADGAPGRNVTGHHETSIRSGDLLYWFGRMQVLAAHMSSLCWREISYIGMTTDRKPPASLRINRAKAFSFYPYGYRNLSGIRFWVASFWFSRTVSQT